MTNVPVRSAHYDTTVVKIDTTRSPRGPDGQKYLASGTRLSMRLWDNEPVGEAPESRRDYETIGYVIEGRAELRVEGQVVTLEPGDSYLVPRGARHTYRILEPFTAVEATSPPAEVHGRDERQEPPSDVEHDARARVLSHIAERASLPPAVTPAAAATAVLGTLIERLTPGEAHELFASTPASLQPLIELCIARREARGTERLERAAFLDRVARELGVTPAHAETISAVVFASVRAELPLELLDDVAHQLPRSLQHLWQFPEVSSANGRVVTQDDARDVLDEIARRVELPSGATASDAFSGVMCALCDRLSGGEARDVWLALPGTMRPLVERCVLHRGEPADVFDREQLFERVATHLRTDVAHAEEITRAVFAAVKRLLPEREVDDVASQLPRDLVVLWESG